MEADRNKLHRHGAGAWMLGEREPRGPSDPYSDPSEEFLEQLREFQKQIQCQQNYMMLNQHQKQMLLIIHKFD